ncbi:Peptidyl-tRNA hydrolase 2, mitochondrial [Frankliniella fusca]|uniref:peptidyl-tRNA hydrolase n=1 Tax=Frankliniella fusca TaxID=407009 RepID=A0AAE1HIE8_9NEOP|nr:Peptidyl-tRNA hydrolase 2, mitochondrial [Frankliniella fusca]
MIDTLVVGAGGLLAGLMVGSPTSRRILQALWYRKSVLANEKIKLVIVVRTDLGMSAGKIAAQSAHAAVMAYCSAEKQAPDLLKLWLNSGQQKVVVRSDMPGERGLMDFVKKANSKGIITSSVVDAGHTQVKRGTLTAVGIGPGPESRINEVTARLRVY